MPNVDRECVTHSFACACREARMCKLEKVAEAMKEIKEEAMRNKCDVVNAPWLYRRIDEALSAIEPDEPEGGA